MHSMLIFKWIIIINKMHWQKCCSNSLRVEFYHCFLSPFVGIEKDKGNVNQMSSQFIQPWMDIPMFPFWPFAKVSLTKWELNVENLIGVELLLFLFQFFCFMYSSWIFYEFTRTISWRLELGLNFLWCLNQSFMRFLINHFAGTVKENALFPTKMDNLIS